MSDEKSVLSPFAPPPSTGADYDAICAAVMETARGRWFLAEYARRNRHADTEAIIGAIERIEARLVNGQDVAPSDRVRFDLKDMAEAIARTRAQIAAIKPDGAGNGALLETSVELDSIVQTTERATSDILAAAEQIQEIAWTAREQGVEGKVCDALDQRATDIYTACAFQDLTGQRTRKVIEVLCFLEERIAAMIEIWGQSADADAGHPMPHIGIGQAGDRLDQAEVDRMMPAPSPMEYVDPPARQNADSPAHADPDADRIASPPAAVSPPSAIAPAFCSPATSPFNSSSTKSPPAASLSPLGPPLRSPCRRSRAPRARHRGGESCGQEPLEIVGLSGMRARYGSVSPNARAPSTPTRSPHRRA